jgi:colicin import membrane protein
MSPVNVNEIRRWSLDLWLQTVRLPLTMTEVVIRHRDDGTWPPAMAFETFEGTVKGFVGRVTHDDTLVELARLQSAEITQRRRSHELQAEATAVDAGASREAAEQQEMLERDRKVADEQAREAKRQVEADRDHAKRALEERTAKKRAANRAAAATRSTTIEREATKADANRLRKDAAALGAKKPAVAAQGEVLKLDKAVRAKKTNRRA